jgi:hypothetical protein
LSTTLLTGMSGISFDMKWYLTSQSHGRPVISIHM